MCELSAAAGSIRLALETVYGIGRTLCIFTGVRHQTSDHDRGANPRGLATAERQWNLSDAR
jgi:hypothetical protein